jgi:patatin-like phospholipase/acyl hydrolase
MTQKITILSIDGGGIRGILPGVIVAYLEDQLIKKTGNKTVRISDYFDLIAGTSTGGILTCMYIAPGADGRPRYTAQQAVDLYKLNGGEIFSIPFGRRILNIFGLFEAKYPVKNIERILKDHLEETTLSQALKPCMVTAYEIFQRKTVFFNKIDTVKKDTTSNETLIEDTRDYKLRDIARSTSAAPTYFKPSKITSVYGNPLYLVDGGVFANNPSMCAYAEARTLKFNDILNRNDKHDFPGATEMIMVSIGTGSQGDPYPYRKAKRWGVVGWLKPLIDILMSGNSETVHYELDQLYSAADPNNKEFYFRLEPTVGTAKSAMDLATIENIKALEEAGKTYVADNVDTLDKIVDLLILNK